MTARRTRLPCSCCSLRSSAWPPAARRPSTPPTPPRRAGASPTPPAGNQAVVRLRRAAASCPRVPTSARPPELRDQGDGSVYRPVPRSRSSRPRWCRRDRGDPRPGRHPRSCWRPPSRPACWRRRRTTTAASAAAQVADAPTTILEIQADGQTFDHQAYALGFEADTGSQSSATEARSNLERLRHPAADLPSMVGGAPGPDEVYDAGALRRDRPARRPPRSWRRPRTRSPRPSWPGPTAPRRWRP